MVVKVVDILDVALPPRWKEILWDKDISTELHKISKILLYL